MVFGGLKRVFGKGTVTGLEETENNAQMIFVICTPFLAGWLAIQMFVPKEYVPAFICGLFFFWLAYIVQYHAYAKADGQKYSAFPQSHWSFPDGLIKTFNVLVPPEGYTEIISYPDGSKGFKVEFTKTYEVKDKILGGSRTYNHAMWKTPQNWDTSFAFKGYGEFFHKGVVIDHGHCENLTVDVMSWEKDLKGNDVPVCLISHSAYIYKKNLEKAGQAITTHEYNEADGLALLLRHSRQENMNLMIDQFHLVDTNETLRSEGQTVRKHSDERIDSFIKKHGNIMKHSRGILYKLKGVKWIVYGLLIIGILFMAYMILTGQKIF